MKSNITRNNMAGNSRRGITRDGRAARLLLSPRPEGATDASRAMPREGDARIVSERIARAAGLGEWLAAMIRGLDALEFLERSRDLAAEAVIASPVRLPTQGR